MKIDEDGDVVVKFGDRHWVFAPACCTAAPGEEIDHVSSQDDGGDSIKFTLGKMVYSCTCSIMIVALSELN